MALLSVIQLVTDGVSRNFLFNCTVAHVPRFARLSLETSGEGLEFVALVFTKNVVVFVLLYVRPMSPSL